MPNKNKSLAWLLEQEAQDYIICDENIKKVDGVRGIYGFFVVGDIKECVYIGRASNIYSRMFSSGGHIPKLRNGTHPIPKLRKAAENSKESKIEIRVLKEVPYVFDNYYRDMQRLASAENKCIDCYQEQGECLEQLPEGTKIKKEDWENEKAIQSDIKFCPVCRSNFRNGPRLEMKSPGYIRKDGSVSEHKHTYECEKCNVRFEINQD